MSRHYININIAITEKSVRAGDGAWLGGQRYSAMVVGKPAHKFLDELEVEYDEQEGYVVIKHAALFTSTIISKLLAAEDLIVKGGRVAGVVTNWAGRGFDEPPHTVSVSTQHDDDFGVRELSRML